LTQGASSSAYGVNQGEDDACLSPQ
jgi:hypothetical protein